MILHKFWVFESRKLSFKPSTSLLICFMPPFLNQFTYQSRTSQHEDVWREFSHFEFLAPVNYLSLLRLTSSPNRTIKEFWQINVTHSPALFSRCPHRGWRRSESQGFGSCHHHCTRTSQQSQESRFLGSCKSHLLMLYWLSSASLKLLVTHKMERLTIGIRSRESHLESWVQESSDRTHVRCQSLETENRPKSESRIRGWLHRCLTGTAAVSAWSQDSSE